MLHSLPRRRSTHCSGYCFGALRCGPGYTSMHWSAGYIDCDRSRLRCRRGNRTSRVFFRGLAMSLTYDNWMDEVFGERSLRMAMWMAARGTSWQMLG